ncbi:MAG: hypothetical protein M3076_19775 [Actinomycetota bacterium]|nr:hypothetical protein [Actinomycetota bacterium]
MHHRIVRHLSPRSAAYLTIGLLVGAGGTYAVAATSSKTISVCADKGTGLLHLKAHGRCAHSQTRVTWNQRGSQGPAGRQGPAGVPAVSIWASEGFNNVEGPNHGLLITHVSAGTYQVTITAPVCAHAIDNTPVVTVVDGNPPTGHSAGAFPVAWITGVPPTGQFTVYTGVVAGGMFTPSDDSFNVYDTC